MLLFVYLGKQGLLECDFIVREPGRSASALQVSWEIGPRNEEREVKGLLEAMETHRLRNGMILTHDQDGYITRDGHRIKLLPTWKWCLENKGEEYYIP